MKTQRIVAAVAAASLLLSSGGVFAQAERNQELLDQAQRDAQRGYPRGDPRSGDARTPATRNQIRAAQAQQSRGGDDRRGDYRGQPAYRNDGGYRADQWRHDGRGAGPSHSFYKGGRLPSQYRGRQYVVDDWRSHHLYAPPRGYQWVQTGGDYVLVAVATGIIAALLLNQ